MSYVAMRGNAAVNGVSRLHGDVSRQILQSIPPRWLASTEGGSEVSLPMDLSSLRFRRAFRFP